MQQFANKTDITIKNSFEQIQFIDWRTQPSNFKTYPNFFRRYLIDNYKELEFIKNFGKITSRKKYGKEEVSLRTNPSAGGLYPCEIYIQIRALKGFLSGIYHYEPLSNTLCLIHELSDDGLEYYFDETSSKKFIILISNVYFRSSWKYGNRAIRYLLLDTGHQLGSILTSLKIEGLDFTLNFDFDKKRLNDEFSFTSQEFFQCAILVDNQKDTKPKKLREKPVGVCPTDYFIKNSFIEEFIEKLNKEPFNIKNNPTFLQDISKDQIQIAINKRRSVRAFKKEPISKGEFDFITNNLFDISKEFGIEIFYINNNIEGIEKGVYKNVTLLKKGDFKKIGMELAFNQKLGSDSCFTLIYTSKDKNYIKTSIFSAFFAHLINLRATHLDISSSGIGAYFDDKTQKFLDTNNNILYLQVVGR